MSIKRYYFSEGRVENIVYVGLLTIHQRDSLMGQLVQPNWYFNPIQDLDNNWIISEEEINNSTFQEHEWVKDLPLIEYKPKPNPIPPIS